MIVCGRNEDGARRLTIVKTEVPDSGVLHLLSSKETES